MKTDPQTPQRPRLAEALACVSGWPLDAVNRWHDEYGDYARLVIALRTPGDRAAPLAITDPREAWEALCTRLDLAGWCDDPRRRFVDPLAVRVTSTITSGVLSAVTYTSVGGRGKWSAPPGATIEPVDRSYPATVADAVAFASDAAGVLAAEAIAREAFVGRHVIVWRLAMPDDPRFEDLPPLGASVTARARWDAHATLAEELDATRRALVGIGYALQGLADDDERAVVLLCPALAGEGTTR